MFLFQTAQRVFVSQMFHERSTHVLSDKAMFTQTGPSSRWYQVSIPAGTSIEECVVSRHSVHAKNDTKLFCFVA